MDQPSTVDAVAAKVQACGGSLVKAPFATYYGHWQLVAADPEGNVLRLTCPTLPSGTQATPLQS